MSQIVPNSFIILSDFHSISWPLEKIKECYLKEYDKIFILGDATDRGLNHDGTGGINLILDIKNLTEKYKDRVFYIPGNHDDFLYNVLKDNNQEAMINMFINGGEQTYQDIQNLKTTVPSVIERLKEWLEKQPLQRTIQYNGRKYALAHAFFNKKLYDIDKDFSLKDLNYYKGKDEYKELSNIIWFRKGTNVYSKDTVPSSEYTVIIGHTPQDINDSTDHNLINENNETVRVICVDGGVHETGQLIKYDGGEKETITEILTHNNTSPVNIKKPNKKELKLSKDKLKLHKEILDEVILDCLKEGSSVRSIVDCLINKNFMGIPNDIELRKKALLIARKSIRQLATQIAIEKEEYLENTKNITILLRNYICELGLNHIIESLKESFGTYDLACCQLNIFLATDTSSYITEKVGNARTVARTIGITSLTNTLRRNNCSSTEEYTKKLVENKVLQK